MPRPFVSPALAFAAAALSVALFSCMDAVMKGLSIAIGPWSAMLWRSVAGVLLSGGLLLVRGAAWPDRAGLIVNVQRSLAAGASIVLFFWGLVRVPMAEGVALTFLAPIFAILLAAATLGERVRRDAVLACLLAFAGVVLILFARLGDGARGGSAGQLAILAASVFYGINLVLLRRSAQAAGPIEVTFITAAVFCLLFGAGAPFLAVLPAPGQWPAILAAAGFAIVSSILLAWAYARAETQALAPVEYTAFVWAAVLGAVVFGERLAAATAAGAVLIVGGAMLGARRTRGPITEAAA